jgi:hypothetical protein
MKYYGRSIILYLSIVTLLYGTNEIWAYSDYSQQLPEMPSDYKPSGLYAGVGNRRGFRPSYPDLRSELNNPKGEFQSAGGIIYRGGGMTTFGGDPRSQI